MPIKPGQIKINRDPLSPQRLHTTHATPKESTEGFIPTLNALYDKAGKRKVNEQEAIENLAKDMQEEQEMQAALEKYEKVLKSYKRVENLDETYQRLFSDFVSSKKITPAQLGEDESLWEQKDERTKTSLNQFLDVAEALQKVEKNDPKYQAYLKSKEQLSKVDWYNIPENLVIGGKKLVQDVLGYDKPGQKTATEKAYQVAFNKLQDMIRPGLEDKQKESFNNYKKYDNLAKQISKESYLGVINDENQTEEQNRQVKEFYRQNGAKVETFRNTLGQLAEWNKKISEDIDLVKNAKDRNGLTNAYKQLGQTLDPTFGIKDLAEALKIKNAEARSRENPITQETLLSRITPDNKINLLEGDSQELIQALADNTILTEYQKYKEQELSLQELKSKVSGGLHFGEGLGESLNFMGQMVVTRGLGKATFETTKKAFIGGLIKNPKFLSKVTSLATKNPAFSKFLNEVGGSLTSVTLMPSTTSNAIEESIGQIRFLEKKDENGNTIVQLGTNETTKRGLLKNINNDIAKLEDEITLEKYKIYDVKPDEQLIKDLEWKIQELKNLKDSFVILKKDAQGNEVEDVEEDKSLGEAYVKSYTENLKEVLAETFVGDIAAKGFRTLGKSISKGYNKSFLKPIGTPIETFANRITGSRVGKLTENLAYHSGLPKIYHGLPAEYVEELAVQITPTYGENYRNQLDELFNPSFHYDVALQTLAMGGMFNVIPTVSHLAKTTANKSTYGKQIKEIEKKLAELRPVMPLTEEGKAEQKAEIARLEKQLEAYTKNNKTYREKVSENRDNKKRLREFYDAIDNAVDDDALANHLLINSSGTIFHDSDYDAQISHLMLEAAKAAEQKDTATFLEKTEQANRLQEISFINRAKMAYDTGTLEDFKYAIEGAISNKGISPEKKKALMQAKKYIAAMETIEESVPQSLSSDRRQREALIDLKMKNLALEYSLNLNQPIIDRAVEHAQSLIDKSGLQGTSFESMDSTIQRVIELQEKNSDELTEAEKEEFRSYSPIIKAYNNLIKDEEVAKAFNMVKTKRIAEKAYQENVEAINNLKAAELQESRKEQHKKDILNLVNKTGSLQGLNALTMELVQTGNIDENVKEAIEAQKQSLVVDEKFGINQQEAVENPPEYQPENNEEVDNEKLETLEDALVDTPNEDTSDTTVENKEKTALNQSEIEANKQEQSTEEDFDPTDLGAINSRRNFREGKEVPKSASDIMKTYIEELGNTLKREVTFKDIIDRFLNKIGKQRTERNFYNLAALARENGIDITLEEVDMFYNAIYNTEAALDATMYEAMEDSDATKDMNENSVNEAKEKVEVKPERQESIDNPIAVQPMVGKDGRTNKDNLKGAYNFQDAQRLSATEWLVSKQLRQLQEDEIVNNHFVLDSDFMAAVEAEAKNNPQVYTARQIDNEDAILKKVRKDGTINLDIVLSGKKYSVVVSSKNPTITWGEAKAKAKEVFAGGEKNYKLWETQFMPVAAVYQGELTGNQPVALTMIHDIEWYSEEADNLSSSLSDVKDPKNPNSISEKERVRASAQAKVGQLRFKINQAENKRLPITIETRTYGTTQMSEDIAPISEHNPHSQLAVVYSVNGKPQVHLGKGIVFQGEILNKDITKITRSGALVHLQQVGTNVNGVKQYMFFYASSPSPKAKGNLNQKLDARLQNTIKYATLASIVLNNQNNKDVLDYIEQTYNFTTEKANQLAKHYGNIIRVNLPAFINRFTRVYGSGDINDFNKNNRIEDNAGLPFIMAAKDSSKFEFEVYGKPAKQGGSLLRTIGGEVKDVRALAANLTSFLQEALPNAQVHLDLNTATNNTKFNFTDENGNLEQVEAKTYQDNMKDFFFTNVISHKIKTHDGKEKWVSDVQPMITYGYPIENNKPTPLNVAETEAVNPVSEDTKEVAKVLDNVNEKEVNNTVGVDVQKLTQELLDAGMPAEEIPTVISQIIAAQNIKDTPVGSRWNPNEVQTIQLNSLKSNSISGLTFEQQKALVSHLKNLIITELNFSENLTVGDIKKAIQEKVKSFLDNKIAYTNNLIGMLEKTGNTTYVASLARLSDLYQMANASQHKLINQVSNEFTSILNTDFESIDTSLSDIEIEEGIENWSKSALEKDVQLSFSKELILSFFGVPKTDGKNKPINNVLGLPEYHNADDVKRRLQDIATEIPSSWAALEKALDNRFEKKHLQSTKNENDYLYFNIKNRLANLPQKVKNELLTKLIGEKVDLIKIEFKENGELTVLNEDSNRTTIKLQEKAVKSFGMKFTKLVGNDLVLNEDFVNNVIQRIETLAAQGNVDPKVIYEFLQEIGFAHIGENTVEEYLKNQGKPLSGVATGNFDIYSNTGLLGLMKNELSKLLAKTDKKIELKDVIYNNMSTPLSLLHKTEALLNSTLLGNSIYISGKTVQAVMPTTKFFDTNRKLVHDTDFRQGFRQSAYTKNNFILELLEIDSKFASIFSQLYLPSIETMKVKGKDTTGNTEYDAIPKSDHLKYTLGLYTSHRHRKMTQEKPFSKFENLTFKMASMLGITMADKGRTPIMTVPVLSFHSGEVFNGRDIELSAEVLDFLYEQIFESEFNSIKASYVANTNYKGVDNAAKLFYSLAEFNTIQIEKDGESVNIHTLLNRKRGYLEQADVDLIKEKAKKLIESYINTEVKKKIDYSTVTNVKGELIDEGLIAVNDDGKVVINYMAADAVASTVGSNTLEKLQTLMTEFVTNTLLTNVAVSQQLYLSKPAFYSKMSVPMINNVVNEKLANDVNYWKEQMETKFAPVLQKRAAQEIAPRQKLADSENINSAYSQEFIHIALNDVESSSDSLKSMIENAYGEFSTEQKEAWDSIQKAKNRLSIIENNLNYQHEYNKIQKEIARLGQDFFPKVADYFNMTGTDAQEYHTWKGYLETLERIGKITPEERSMYASIIESGNELSKEQLDFLMSSDLSMQPIKGVYTSQVFDGKDMRPVYIKSSAFPLFPQLTSGLEIDKVRQMMENLETEKSTSRFTPVRASYQTANKIGSLNTALNMQHIYSNNQEVLREALETATSVLPISGWGIQQETPSKEVGYRAKNKDAHITMGSQFFKTITGNFISSEKSAAFTNLFDKTLLSKLGIDIEADNLTGEQLSSIYNRIYESYSEHLQKELYNELGLKDNFDNLSQDQKNTVIERITDIIKKEITERSYPDYLKDSVELIQDSNGNLTTESVLLMDNNRHKFESLLHALISNRLITHKLPGNSHVAGSNEGFKSIEGFDNLSEETQKGITWLNGRPKNNLQATTLENGVLKEAEVLIKPHWKYKNAQGEFVYVDLSQPQYWTNGEFNTEMIDPELLSMFSFRIPTSSHQSGAILKIVGFLPAWSEDLLIVPPEHTVQIGEDYDIDKRNIYKSHYNVVINPDGTTGRIEKLNSETENYLDTLDYTEKFEILRTEFNNFIDEIKEDNEQLKALSKLSGAYLEMKARNVVDNLLEAMLGESVSDAIAFETFMNHEDIKALTSIYNLEKSELDKRYKKALKDKYEQKLIENALIDVYKAVYTSTSTTVQNKIFKPLVTEVADTTASLMENKLKKSEKTESFSIYSDSFQRSLLKNGADGKAGIGVHSNAVVLESQFQRLEDKVDLTEMVVEDNAAYLSYFVEAIGNQTSFNNLGNNTNTIEGSREVSEQHAENQNVSTDNVNKQIMYKRNENSYTIGVYALMAHLGFDLSSDVVSTGLFNSKNKEVKEKLHIPSLLMNQPIIRDLVDYISKNSSVTSEVDFMIDANALHYLAHKYGFTEDIFFQENGEINTSDFLANEKYENTSRELTGQKLWDMLLENDAKLNSMAQAVILQKFFRFKKKAQEISEVQQLINMSTSKLGVSYFQTLQKLAALDKLGAEELQRREANLPSSNMHKLIGDVQLEPTEGYKKVGEYYWKAETIEGNMVLNSLEASSQIMPIFFPYQSKAIQNVIQRIFDTKKLDINKKSEKNLKLKYEIMTEMINYLNTNTSLFSSDLSKRRQSLFFDTDSNMSLGSVLEHLRQVKSPVMENVFLKALEVEKTLQTGFAQIKHQLPEQTSFDKTLEYENFQELLSLNEVVKDSKGQPVEVNGEVLTVRDLMVDLASYAFLAKDSMAIGFKQFIPTNFLKIAGVNADHRKMFEAIVNEDETFATELETKFVRQYFQHNPTKAPKSNKEKVAAMQPEERPDFYHMTTINKVTGEILGTRLFEKTSTGYKEIAVLGNEQYKEYDAKQNEVKSKVNRNPPVFQNDLKFENGNKYALNSRGEYWDMAKYKSVVKANINDNIQDLFTFLNNLSSTTAADKLLLQEFAKYVNRDTQVKVQDLPNGDLGYFQPTENTVYINENILELLLDGDANGKLKEANRLLKEVVMEELLHSITVNEIKQHVNFDADYNMLSYKTDNPPNFVTRLVALFEAAQKAIPYNENDTSTYYSKNILEFMAGMYVAEDYRVQIEEKIPNFAERLLKAFKDLFNYLWKNSSENISEQYKQEVHAALVEMLEYHKKEGNKGVELPAKAKLEQIKDEKVEIPEIKEESKDNTIITYNSKIPLSKTMSDFLNVFFDYVGEDVIEPFAKKLTNEDKEILSKAVGRTYKDIKNFDWNEAIFSDIGMEEVFYYLKTGNQLEKNVNKNYLESELYKDFQNFNAENKDFVENFHKLPENIKKEQQKDYNKLKEKNEWYLSALRDLEYQIRKELLNKEGYVEYKVKFDNNMTNQENTGQNLSNFINYSGGAQGGDTIWENIGKEFGLGKQVNYRPEDLKKLNQEQLQEVENAYQQAVKDLRRRPLDVNSFVGGLVRRDYLQARAADAIFAISTIVESKQKDPKGYVNKTNRPLVAGGTGYAVQMAINLGKPVYIFDQNKNQWFTWNNNTFEKVETPTLTNKFAGIGTREINESGKQAIRDVYEKTTKPKVESRYNSKLDRFLNPCK